MTDESSKYACVCASNSKKCKLKIEEIPKLKPNDVVIYETSKDSSERMKQIVLEDSIEEEVSPSWSTYVFDIDSEKKFQKIIGFGGALTDATFLNLNSMGEEVKDEIFENYFGKSGIEYTLGRVPIGSTDFSQEVYSYCEKKDLSLESFSIGVDKGETTGFKLQNLKRVLEIVENRGSNMKLFASPWAPPAWMTDTGEVIHNPRLSVLKEIKKVYTEYLKKFFQEYQSEGVAFWGMTVQNEPDGNLGEWQSLRFSPEEYRDFVKEFLGPELKTEFPDLKIIMHDDQR